MSLKSFFDRLIKNIGKLFHGAPAELKFAIHWGVAITQAIKTFVESPVADVFTAIIPGTLDDKIKEKLRKAIPAIFISLKLADDCSNETDPTKIVICGINTLESITGDFKKDFLDALAVQLALVVADGKFDWDDVKRIAKYYYDHIYKPDPVAAEQSILTENAGDTNK